MSRGEPTDQEEDKGRVAQGLVARVLEHLGEWEEDVGKVHERQDDVTHARRVVAVTAYEQGAREYVVTKHLEVVLPLDLEVEGEYALQPECQLHEVVHFEGRVESGLWPVGVELGDVPPVLRVVEEVHAYREGRRSVCEPPRLFRESQQCLWLRYAAQSTERCEDVGHHRGTYQGEEYDAEHD